jgi:hypothetical protein
MRISATLVLLLVNAGLAAALAYLSVNVDPEWHPPGVKPPAADVLVAEKIERGRADVSALPDMLMKPLFSESRRPPPPPPPPAVAEAPPVKDPFSDLLVIGLIDAGEVAGGAIVRSGKEVRRVTVGGFIDGWRLEKISGYTATFSKGGASRSINMTFLPQPASGGDGKETTDAGASSGGGQASMGGVRKLDPEVARARNERNAARLAEIQKQFGDAAGRKK